MELECKQSRHCTERKKRRLDSGKCPYHNGRACMEIIQRIDNILNLIDKMRILITSLLSIVMMAACTQGGESDRVEDLLEKMTIEEKVGQLIQYTGRWEMTGPAPDNEYARAGMQKIESGELGSMLNVMGARATRNAQKLAIEKSRLGIPMIFGYDVIHGYRTMFPMPLAELPPGSPSWPAKHPGWQPLKLLQLACTGLLHLWLTLPGMPAGAGLWKAEGRIPTWVPFLPLQE